MQRVIACPDCGSLQAETNQACNLCGKTLATPGLPAPSRPTPRPIPRPPVRWKTRLVVAGVLAAIGWSLSATLSWLQEDVTTKLALRGFPLTDGATFEFKQAGTYTLVYLPPTSDDDSLPTAPAVRFAVTRRGPLDPRFQYVENLFPTSDLKSASRERDDAVPAPAPADAPMSLRHLQSRPMKFLGAFVLPLFEMRVVDPGPHVLHVLPPDAGGSYQWMFEFGRRIGVVKAVGDLLLVGFLFPAMYLAGTAVFRLLLSSRGMPPG